MVSQPIALGMMICDHVIVEQGTAKISFVGGFNKLKSGKFPARLPPFELAATLAGSFGDVGLEVRLSRLETGASFVIHRRRQHFPDKLAEVLFRERFRDISLPVPGYYQFTLLAEGEWVAQRRLLLEESP